MLHFPIDTPIIIGKEPHATGRSTGPRRLRMGAAEIRVARVDEVESFDHATESGERVLIVLDGLPYRSGRVGLNGITLETQSVRRIGGITPQDRALIMLSFCILFSEQKNLHRVIGTSDKNFRSLHFGDALGP
jgi:hypothetical protein